MPDKKITQAVIDTIIKDLLDARERTLALIEGLDRQQIMGPKLATVNPLLWEIGHVAYFHEFWILRHLDGRESFLENADVLYDSISIAHDDRWSLPLLTLDETKAYMAKVLDAVIRRLQTGMVSSEDIYLSRYATFHEDMHGEAFTYSRRTLDYPAPAFGSAYTGTTSMAISDPVTQDDDIYIAGGEYQLGAPQGIEFCFDNEKWQHSVEIKPFAIARTATSYEQYAAFVDDGGYSDRRYWDGAGWNWLQSNDISRPNGWDKDETGDWLIKQFDGWIPMQKRCAVCHINWYEANAYCRWANRRLPTEAEWELAASGSDENINRKHTYPWGEESPTARHVNMDSLFLHTIDVDDLPDGDSAFGCRQMLGNVWEWTSDTFEPYPGFKPDMYQDYSQPLFSDTKVLRGGAWSTRSRMIRNTWRNYYGPDRNDIFAGFRTCAIENPG